MHESTGIAPRGNRTRPWAAEEYAYVDGAPLVYTVDSKTGEMTIRFPGRGYATVEQLKSDGRSVVLPKTVRTNHLA